MGDLVLVSAVSVALADPALPVDMCAVLLDHLEDIVMGSHPSLGRLVDCCFGTAATQSHSVGRAPPPV